MKKSWTKTNTYCFPRKSSWPRFALFKEKEKNKDFNHNTRLTHVHLKHFRLSQRIQHKNTTRGQKNCRAWSNNYLVCSSFFLFVFLLLQRLRRQVEKWSKTVEMLGGHMIKAPVWVRRGAQKVEGGGVRWNSRCSHRVGECMNGPSVRQKSNTLTKTTKK